MKEFRHWSGWWPFSPLTVLTKLISCYSVSCHAPYCPRQRHASPCRLTVFRSLTLTISFRPPQVIHPLTPAKLPKYTTPSLRLALSNYVSNVCCFHSIYRLFLLFSVFSSNFSATYFLTSLHIYILLWRTIALKNNKDKVINGHSSVMACTMFFLEKCHENLEYDAAGLEVLKDVFDSEIVIWYFLRWFSKALTSGLTFYWAL